MKIRLATLISLALLGLAVAVKTAQPLPFTEFEYRVFDFYQQLKPRKYEEVPVRIVDIDDESLKRLGQWPWSRTQVAELVDRLHKAGAAAIVFDIVFAEPDRTAPQQILKAWKKQSDLAPLLKHVPDPDKVFADSIKRSRTVTGFVLTHDRTTATPALKAGYAFAGEADIGLMPAFSGAVVPLPVLEKAALGNGALNSEPDTDGILRRIPLFFRIEGKPYPSLVAESLRTAQGAGSYTIKTVGSGAEGSSHSITDVRIGDITIPTDAKGGLWIYFTHYLPERYVPAWKMLDGSFDPQAVDGHIVLIGTSAAGLKDIRSTPLNAAGAGVEVHAQAIEQALLGITLARPDWILGAEICLMVLIGLMMMTVTTYARPIWAALLMAALIAAGIGVSWYAFTAHGLLVEPVSPFMAVILLYFTGSLSRYIRAERERQQVRDAFSHYMSPLLVEQLARHPEKLKLGGENRELTIMFSDIRGFTTLSEQLTPEELTQLINSFLTPMTAAVLARQGTIDKYIGDCIMAFWNAPMDVANHASHAARAALDMLGVIEGLNAQRGGKDTLRVGIGLNTGVCCVGNMGSDQRFNYSALGDEVNLASRLEGQCKFYGSDIILGRSTATFLTRMALIELDLIRVKGKKQATQIYTLLGDETFATAETFQLLARQHDEMLKAYRAREWKKAEVLAAECRVMPCAKSLLQLYGLYIARCQENMLIPPPATWDGVYDADSK